MPFEIKAPITGDILKVAEYDFSEDMTLEEAQQACREHGNGWRLPEKEELKVIFEHLHKVGKGNFKNTWYWESSGRKFNFADGRLAPQIKQQRIEGFYYPQETNRMRAVLSLPKPFGISRLWRW